MTADALKISKEIIILHGVHEYFGTQGSVRSRSYMNLRLGLSHKTQILKIMAELHEFVLRIASASSILAGTGANRLFAIRRPREKLAGGNRWDCAYFEAKYESYDQNGVEKL